MSYWNEIAVLAGLILLNGLLSMAEAAMLSSRKARLQQMANDGDKASSTVLRLLEDPNVFLSTVQIGITLVGVLAGAVPVDAQRPGARPGAGSGPFPRDGPGSAGRPSKPWRRSASRAA